MKGRTVALSGPEEYTKKFLSCGSIGGWAFIVRKRDPVCISIGGSDNS